MYPFSENSISLIKHFESLHDGDLNKIGLQPKMDPTGIWTEGYGRAMRDPRNPNKFLKGKENASLALKYQTIRTDEEAERALIMDLQNDYVPTLRANIEPYTLHALNPDKLGALLSFVYNCGTGYKNKLGIFTKYAIFTNVEKYLLGKLSSKGLQQYWETSVIKGGGKVLPGLVRRRKAEAHLFLTGDLKFF